MGLAHLVQKIILCVIDITIIGILTTQWIFCIKFILIDKQMIKGIEIFSATSLLIALFI